MFNIPESSITDKKEASKEDVLKLKAILDPEISIEQKSVGSIYRIGTRSKDKVRPLIIRFNDSNIRAEVLKLRNLVYIQENHDNKDRLTNEQEGVNKHQIEKNQNQEQNDEEEAKKQQNEKNNKIKIFITPDRTKRQQEANRELVAELKRRKDSGEKDIFISNGKIVSQPFRFNPHAQWPS